MAKKDDVQKDIKSFEEKTTYLNKLSHSSKEVDQLFYRLYYAAECYSPKELATFLDVSVCSIANAKKIGKIPAEWLLLLFQVKNIFPEWITKGIGPMYFERPLEGYYESGRAFTERMEDRVALRKLSSRTLTEELLRRLMNG